MWMGQGLYESSGQPPAYMFDSRFRDGISAMLVLDRAEEEEHRLEMEAVIMAQWVRSQLENTDHALKACAGQQSVLIHDIRLILIVRWAPSSSAGTASKVLDVNCKPMEMGYL
jgi:hypothetical protein